MIYTLAYFCLVSVAKERKVFDTGSSSPVNMSFYNRNFSVQYKGNVCPENTKGGNITVPLTSCWTGLKLAV